MMNMERGKLHLRARGKATHPMQEHSRIEPAGITNDKGLRWFDVTPQASGNGGQYQVSGSVVP